MKISCRGIIIEVKRGDILEEEVDAIVNPANSYMVMGGGLAAAIKRAGGEGIEREARRHAPVPIGKAVATSAGRLRAKFVIHSPTMERPGPTTAEKVYLAARAALSCAEGVGARSLAMAAMGAGVGGLPLSDSAMSVVKAIKEAADRGSAVERVVLVGLNDQVVSAFTEALRRLGVLEAR